MGKKTNPNALVNEIGALVNEIGDLTDAGLQETDPKKAIPTLKNALKRLGEVHQNYSGKLPFDNYNLAVCSVYIGLSRAYIKSDEPRKAQKAYDSAKKFFEASSGLAQSGEYGETEYSIMRCEARLLLAQGKSISTELQDKLEKRLINDETFRTDTASILYDQWKATIQPLHSDKTLLCIIRDHSLGATRMIWIAEYLFFHNINSSTLIQAAITIMESANQAAKQEIGEHEYNLGLARFYKLDKQYEKAKAAAQRALQYGDEVSDQSTPGFRDFMGITHFTLATICDENMEPSEQTLAISHYRQAADFGLSTAMHNLGWKLLYGEGTDCNLTEGFQLLSQALDTHPANNPARGLTLETLGACYRLGLGTEVDPQTAKQYLTEAYDTYHIDAAGRHLALLYAAEDQVEASLILFEKLLSNGYQFCTHEAYRVALGHADAFPRYVDIFKTHIDNMFAALGQEQQELRDYKIEVPHELELKLRASIAQERPYLQWLSLISLVDDDSVLSDINSSIVLLLYIANVLKTHPNIGSSIHREFPRLTRLLNALTEKLTTQPSEFDSARQYTLLALSMLPISRELPAMREISDTIINVMPACAEGEVQAIRHAEIALWTTKLARIELDDLACKKVIGTAVSYFNQYLNTHSDLTAIIDICYALAMLHNQLSEDAKQSLPQKTKQDLFALVSTLMQRMASDSTNDAYASPQWHHYAHVACLYFMQLDEALSDEIKKQLKQTTFANPQASSKPDKTSYLQRDVERVLAQFQTAPQQTEAGIAGFCVDILLQPTTSDDKDSPIIVVEVDGPSHFVMKHDIPLTYSPKDKLREAIIRIALSMQHPNQQVAVVRVPYYLWPNAGTDNAKKSVLKDRFTAAKVQLESRAPTTMWQVVPRSSKQQRQVQQSYSTARQSPSRHAG